MMAHEVNNTVGPVNSILQSALTTSALWKTQTDNLLSNALQAAFDRNQNLNLFMRNFADLVKLPPANKRPVDLQVLVIAVMDLMQLKAQERRVKFVFLPLDAPLMINADAEQLEQALINIVKNAMEAIEHDGLVSFVLDSKKQLLTITDSGKGIGQADSGELFSPFFSTKKDGQGIGLTLVREILLNHGFEFSLKSGNGSTVFSICLG